MIWTIALVIGILLVAVSETFNALRWYRRINYIADVIIPMKDKKDKQPKWIPYSETQEKEHFCPNCSQPCSKGEYEHGFCLDCDQIEFFDDFEEV